MWISYSRQCIGIHNVVNMKQSADILCCMDSDAQQMVVNMKYEYVEEMCSVKVGQGYTMLIVVNTV